MNTPKSIETVLLVDDEEDIRTVAALTLGRLGGWKVIEAASGAECIPLAISEEPDVILLDYMMPGMDGEATLNRLRADPRTQGIPVVFCTARILPDDIERFSLLGAAGLIAKPFDPIELARQITLIWESFHGIEDGAETEGSPG